MCKCMNIWYSSVLQISPPFWNLSLSTKPRGGLYAGCDNFSCDYALTSGKPWSHCWWWGPSARRRDAPDASGRLMSFSVEGRGSRALPRSSWHVHRWCGCQAVRVRGRHFNGRQLSGFSTAGWVFFWGGGGESLYVEYTSARLCAKNVGGALCARGVFAGHYSTSVKRMWAPQKLSAISCQNQWCVRSTQ